MRYCVECKHYRKIKYFDTGVCTVDDIIRINPVTGKKITSTFPDAWWRREERVSRIYKDDCPDFTEKPLNWWDILKAWIYGPSL